MKENAITNYIKGCFREINKVTWPTKNQTVKLTFIVLGFIFASAIVLGVFDYGFNFGFRNLLNLRTYTALPTSEPIELEVGGEEGTPLSEITITPEGTVEGLEDTPLSDITLSPEVVVEEEAVEEVIPTE